MAVLMKKSRPVQRAVRPGGVLLTSAQIARRGEEGAREIGQRHAGTTPVVVAVLKGSFMFLADLLRKLEIPTEVDFLSISSYEGERSSGIVRLHFDVRKEIKNRDVILVDDIVDTGISLSFIRKHLLAKKPKSLEICVLLDKPSRRKVFVPIRYVGFSIPDKFVVGYGLYFN